MGAGRAFYSLNCSLGAASITELRTGILVVVVVVIYFFFPHVAARGLLIDALRSAAGQSPGGERGAAAARLLERQGAAGERHGTARTDSTAWTDSTAQRHSTAWTDSTAWVALHRQSHGTAQRDSTAWTDSTVWTDSTARTEPRHYPQRHVHPHRGFIPWPQMGDGAQELHPSS